MLRSTGFFRGLDCPFYTGGGDGESGCNRPYCHFRHSNSRQRASSGVYEIGKAKDGPPDSNNQGYDPFNPEVVWPVEKYNAEPPASPGMDPGATELELVNRAIEAVQSEMEKEKKRLSRIGEQGYDPANSSIKAGYSRQAVAAVSSHSAYDPGSYQMSQSSEYNPTPRSSKYTLDSENNNSSSYANSMEYVPTAVSRVAAKKAAPAPMSRIPTTCSSSSKNKYTLDNLRPPTDMEYDPMSNFSAKPGAKGVKAVGTEGDGRKRVHPRWQKQSTDEEYVPVAKKPRQLPVEEPQKYMANYESDEESSGNEYRPTPKSRLQRRKSSGDSADNEKRKSRETGTCRQPPAQEFTIDGDEDEEFDSFEPLDSEQPDDEPPDKKWTKNSIQAKKGPSEKTVRKELTESVKKSSSHKEKKGSSGTEKTSKKPSQESGKKEKSHGKVVEEKGKTKDSEKGGKGLKLKDGKSKKPDKKKGEQSHGDKERNIGEAKKPKVDKVHQSVKEPSKYKEQKNGRIESGGREKDKKKSSSSSSTTTTTSSSSSKDKHKKTSSSLGKKDAKVAKAKPRSLSHADLFGDESPEEEEEEDEEDEEDERVVRKSVSAFKRRSLVNKRKASDATETSSDDDIGPGDEHEHEHEHGDDGDAADFPMLQEDVDYDSDPMEECLRIFNESGYVKTEDKGRQAKQPPKEEDQDAQSTLTTLFPGQKKRVSHFKAKGSTEPSLNVMPKPQRRLTAQEVCYQRMQIAQQQAAELAASAAKNASPASRPLSSAAASGEKRRVMHRPNPALVAAKKPVLSESQQASRGVLSPSRAVPDQSSVRAHTSATMLSKTVSTSAQKRVAHTPTLKSSSMKRPIIPTEFGAKVPTNVRQRYLSVFIDECLKFCPSEEASFQMALDEEKLVYDRSSSKNIYLNVAVNALKKLRSKSATPSAPSPPAASPSTGKTAVSVRRKSQSHEGVLGGRLAATTSYTINRTGKQQDVQLKGAVLYWKLKEYVLSEEQLQEHGYPRPHPEHLGHAVIYNAPEKKNQDPFAKVCCRCGAEYKVNASGNCVRKEECNHHWGRLRRYKVSGGWETQYSCCSGAVGSPGCQVAKQHVQDNRKESLDGYVKTFSKPSSSDGNAGVYALDCEMCYTKQGLELTRVTVINSDLKVVYDTFVKPESKVVDYNTRFSGVTEEDLESATMRLRDVQAVLLNMFSAESILIGHSLESDLFALKLLHSTVIDTAVVFPHRLGLPYKRALRNVMADHLKRIIQDNAEGHDSSEDAAACMELMIWKIKEDAKVKR